MMSHRTLQPHLQPGVGSTPSTYVVFFFSTLFEHVKSRLNLHGELFFQQEDTNRGLNMLRQYFQRDFPVG